MDSHAKLFGHAAHPMLVVLPLGLFIFAVVCDLIYLVTREPSLGAVAYWNIGGGVVGGLAAALVGAVDWGAIPAGTRAKRIATFHGICNVVVVLFAGSWLLRRDGVDYQPSTVAVALSVAGLAVGTVAAWLGGELVDRLGVGVDDGAHLNAPNSMSGRPAR
jgi:uncharacterized membrane protein